MRAGSADRGFYLVAQRACGVVNFRVMGSRRRREAEVEALVLCQDACPVRARHAALHKGRAESGKQGPKPGGSEVEVIWEIDFEQFPHWWWDEGWIFLARQWGHWRVT